MSLGIGRVYVVKGSQGGSCPRRIFCVPCVWKIWLKCQDIAVLLSGFSSISLWKWNTFVSCIVKLGPSNNNPLAISSRFYNVITLIEAFPWRLSSLTVISHRSLGVAVPSALLQIVNKLTWLVEVLETFYLTLCKKSDSLTSTTLISNLPLMYCNPKFPWGKQYCVVLSFWGDSSWIIYLTGVSDLPYFWQKVTLSILLILGIIIIKIDS